ncbi:hypothetical protein [Catenovulum agarivorans]|uniref:hypothetical protein n=1 Tax=Catenovulum agarivorans TaxID=1172192 RepID=UPI00031AC30C|nr:hypothetical protein [Catenovulum agarivorans]
MSDSSFWDKRNQSIVNSIGHWQGGVDVTIEGYSLTTELMGKISYMQLHILNATGKLVARNVADWIEINLMGLSYPDSRIWCNQIAAHAGDTHSSSVAASAAAILSADSRAYGGSQTTFSCMSYLQLAYQEFKKHKCVETIVEKAKYKNGKPMIVGFARPIDREDERLAPYKENLKNLQLTQGEFLEFAYLLSDYLDNKFNLSINSGGFASAFLLDQGFSPDDGYNIKAFCVISGAIASYRNARPLPTNSFLPMKCSDIEYKGLPPRKIP